MKWNQDFRAGFGKMSFLRHDAECQLDGRGGLASVRECVSTKMFSCYWPFQPFFHCEKYYLICTELRRCFWLILSNIVSCDIHVLIIGKDFTVTTVQGSGRVL